MYYKTATASTYIPLPHNDAPPVDIASISASSIGNVRVSRAGASQNEVTTGPDGWEGEASALWCCELSIFARNSWKDALTFSGAAG